MKKVFPKAVLVFLILIIGWGFLRFVIGGPEDDWICVDGQWVKHGAPRAPKPTGACGRKKKEKPTPTIFLSEEKDEDLEKRLKTLRDHLHDQNSGPEAKKLLPDLTPIYTDDGHDNRQFPKEILPFTYYYSPEADITVSICNINQTVFICPGKLDRLIQPQDFDNCQVAQEYLQIER
jgi:hypothetical protein